MQLIETTTGISMLWTLSNNDLKLCSPFPNFGLKFLKIMVVWQNAARNDIDYPVIEPIDPIFQVAFLSHFAFSKFLSI